MTDRFRKGPRLIIPIFCAAIAGIRQAAAGSAEETWHLLDLRLLMIFAAAALGAFLGSFVALRGRRANHASSAGPKAPVLSYAAPLSSSNSETTTFADSADEAASDDEGRRLFDYLTERFGRELGTADGAIAYFERLGGEIGRLKAQLATLEQQIELQPRTGESSHYGWLTEAIARGGRAIESAQDSLLDDPELTAFAGETRLAEVVERLKRLRTRLSEAAVPGSPFDAMRLLEEPWLHRLFRADAICSTYYPTIGSWNQLRLGLALSALALRERLLLEGVVVDFVRLLTPVRGEESEITYDEQSGLRNLEPARRVISSYGGAVTAVSPMVIDCLSFGWKSPRDGAVVRSEVVVYNPADWM